jgi:hypothetical protein
VGNYVIVTLRTGAKTRLPGAQVLEDLDDGFFKKVLHSPHSLPSKGRSVDRIAPACWTVEGCSA